MKDCFIFAFIKSIMILNIWIKYYFHYYYYDSFTNSNAIKGGSSSIIDFKK